MLCHPCADVAFGFLVRDLGAVTVCSSPPHYTHAPSLGVSVRMRRRSWRRRKFSLRENALKSWGLGFRVEGLGLSRELSGEFCI